MPIDKKSGDYKTPSELKDALSNSANVLKKAKKAVILLLILILVWSSFFIVYPGERVLVFNSFTGLKESMYGEGIHFKIPLFESVIRMNIRTQKQEEGASAASKDLQDTHTQVAVNFRVDPDKLPEIYRTIGPATTGEDYMQTEIMNPIILESVKFVTSRYTAEELITKRPQVKKEIDQVIADRLSKYYVIVIDVSITDFKFSDQFTRAIEEKVTAEQNALKEKNNLEVIKFQAQQKVEQAKGEAESIRIVNEELLKSPKYIDYLTIQKWDGKMPLALGSGSLLSITGTEK